MGRYIIRRLLQAILVVFGISLIVFMVLRLSGDPARLMLPMDATNADVEVLRQALGLNDPLPVQYFTFMSGVLHGDFGISLRHQQPALQLVLERYPATIELTLAALLVGCFIGLPVGILSALKKDTIFDGLAMLGALVGQSMPGFWLGIMLILLFGVQLRLLPVAGRDTLAHLVMPAFTLGLFTTAIIARMTRSAVLEVMGNDYIKTARAKGLPEFLVVTKHALRNALIPVVTVIGLQLGLLLGGTVIIETVFAWPGVGRLAIEAIYNRDYPLVQAAVFTVAASYTLINLGVDLLYAFLNPQIKYE